MSATPETAIQFGGGFPDHPKAYLGFRSCKRKDACFMVAVCAWCDDLAEAEALAKKGGFPVTHGCCVGHHQKMMAELLGEKSD